TCSELMAHLAQVKEIAGPLGIGFLGLGMTPTWSRAEIPMMPKGRYRIMTAYMPKVGRLGLDMMYRTCTVQTNLDYSDEADMVKKLRVSLALQPVATALFANSPFTEGRPNGFLSFRSEIWRNTDPDRSGMLPWASAPPCRIGQTTSRRSFRRCGSSATWRCAAPTAGRGGCCRRCRPIGSACS